jgi:hypothetical protein
LLRRAVASYSATEDEVTHAGMISHQSRTIEQAGVAIDEALALIEASNRRIDAMKRKAA